MAKKEISSKVTRLDGEAALQAEQTLTVNDCVLPTPAEMAAYREIDPNLITFLQEYTSREQQHRHETDKMKLKMVQRSEGKSERTNFWGMFFAFLALLAIIAVCAYALYLDKPWFAGIVGGTVIVSVISLFVNGGKDKHGK